MIFAFKQTFEVNWVAMLIALLFLAAATSIFHYFNKGR